MTGWWKVAGFRAAVTVLGVATVLTVALLIARSIVIGTAYPSWAVLLLGLPTVVILAFALVVVGMKPWREAAKITAMLGGDAWAHWTYDESNWRVANQFSGRTFALWVRGLLIALGPGVLLLVVGLARGREGTGFTAVGAMVVFPVSVALAVLLGNPMYLAHRARQGEVYLSGHGIYWQPGGYFDLAAHHNLKYDSVDFVELPPHIHIVGQVYVDSGLGGTWIRRTLADVGVPYGHEDEARAVVERLRLEVVDGVHIEPPKPPVLDQGW